MSVARPVNQLNSENIQKRAPGSVLPNGHWCVIDESKKIDDEWFHSCGEKLLGKELTLTREDGLFPLSGGGDETATEFIVYCPKCESEPISGFITSKGQMVIN